MREFCGLFPQDLGVYLEQQQVASYRLQQLFDWVYKKGVMRYQEMSNLPAKLRSFLENQVRLGVLSADNIEESADGETTKFLWKLTDGQHVESVLIRSGQRRTVCVSSQVGCPARCAFCASGKQGLLRNLTVAEIIEQIVRIHSHLLAIQERVTHIVFMGMGEPLENYDAVVSAVKILTHPQLFGLSPRRVTISTVGVIPGIHRLMEENIPVNLALSLHAPTQQLRKKIVPYARQFDLVDILRAVRLYAQHTKRDVTYEYVLLSGLNDRPEDAKELCKLLKNEHCCVNLIPFNPISGVVFKRPSKEAIERFRAILAEGRVRSTCRYTKGKDIAAACGQLALKQKSLSSLAENKYKETEKILALQTS